MQVRLKMAETLREAVTFVEQGHVRVGPDTGAEVTEAGPCAAASSVCFWGFRQRRL